MNPSPDAQQEIIRLQVARLLQRAIDLVAVDESLSCERPDPAEEDPKSVVLDVETIQPLARGGGRLPLLFPKATHMQEVLEGIKGGLYPLPEPNRQSLGSNTGRMSRKELSCLPVREGMSSTLKGNATQEKPSRSRNPLVCSI